MPPLPDEPQRPAFPIHVFETLPSTNDTILDAGESTVPEGLTHIARAQTRGRGRGGHRWWSPRDAGLWMSTLLRPGRPRPLWSGLSLLAGSAVRRALADLGVPDVALYWPNDLKVSRRKIGGILGEVRARGTRAWVALGVGVNIDFGLADIPADLPRELRGQVTSMVDSGKPTTTDPLVIAREILGRFWPLYSSFEAGGDLAELLRGELAHAGRKITVSVAGRLPWEGTIEGLGPYGELLVRASDPESLRADSPPGGDWMVSRPGVVAVSGGEVTYQEEVPGS